MDFPVEHINLPTLENGVKAYREVVEDFIVDMILEQFGDTFTVKKYYKTVNKEIYEDCSNMVQSGVPAYLVRTRREDTDPSSIKELTDWVTCRIEVLVTCSVHVEKEVVNAERYTYIMNKFLRDLLRENPLSGLRGNQKKPFVYLGNRDVYRDDDLDIILAEYNVDYVKFKSETLFT